MVVVVGMVKIIFYKVYGLKEGFVEVVFECEGSFWWDWFVVKVDVILGDVINKLVNFFDVLCEWFVEESFFGCLFINVVGEYDKEDDWM